MFCEKPPESLSADKFLIVLRASATKPISGMLYGLPVRAMTHYFRGKTLPCIQEEADCPLCRIGLTTRYYAYYPIKSKSGTNGAVELTGTAEHDCLELIERAPDLNAVILTVSRAPGKRNNPLTVAADYKVLSVAEYQKYLANHLPSSMVKSTLCRLWGIPQQDSCESQEEYISKLHNYLEFIVRESR